MNSISEFLVFFILEDQNQYHLDYLIMKLLVKITLVILRKPIYIRIKKLNLGKRNTFEKTYSSINRDSSVVICDRRLDKRCEYLSLFANHLRRESSA
jgi:hypothetical protein